MQASNSAILKNCIRPTFESDGDGELLTDVNASSIVHRPSFASSGPSVHRPSSVVHFAFRIPHPAFHKALWYAFGSLVLAFAMLVQPAAGAPLPTARAALSAPGMAGVLPNVGAPVSSTRRYFAATGKVVRGPFFSAYKRFGLAAVGYPLSDELQEDGHTVQYFERVRMEYHPEAASKGHGVMLTRLGDDISKPIQPFAKVAPFKSTRARVFLKETGHSVSEPFLSYWKAKGGVALFGYPISEAMVQDGMRVQWFERARFEYHPELAAKGQPVQLSLLGKASLEKTSLETLLARPAPPAQAPAPAKQPAAISQAKIEPEVQMVKVEQANLTPMENLLLKAINEQRASAGLRPVAVSASVTGLARARSGDMAARDYFSHTTPEGAKFLSMLKERGIPFRYAGEILARNNYPEAEAAQTAMNSYLDSPPHKAIILDERYNLVGIGYARSEEDGMHYFTVIFLQQ